MQYMSNHQLLQLLYEKDCYIQALESQLQAQRQEIDFLRLQVRNRTEEDADLNQSQEVAISQSRIEQFQSSDQKLKFKQPLSISNSMTSTRNSNYVQQKFIHESVDIDHSIFDSQVSQQKGGVKIFEDFFIVGIDHKDIQQSRDEPRIIYSFNSRYSSNDKKIASMIPFMLPSGTQPGRLSIKDNYSDVYQILYQNYNLENKNCFLLIMKQMDKQITQYNVCLRYDEFSFLDKDQIFSHKRVLCISTQFYFIDFYFQLLLGLVNQVKLKRMSKIKSTQSLQSIDSQLFDQSIEELIQSSLCQLSLVSFQKSQKLQFTLNKQQYKVQEADEIQWGIMHMMARLKPSDLVKIFVSILMEKSVVFFSQSPMIVTASILVSTKYLIRPFQWVHPIISLLPSQHVQFLESPVPILIGIESSVQALQPLIQSHASLLFVNIQGQSVEFYNHDNIPIVSQELMTFLCQKLQQNFENQYLKFGVLEQLLRTRIVQNLPPRAIFHMMSMREAKRKSMLDYQKLAEKTLDALTQQGSPDKFLWKQFFQTQIFTQFLDSHYQIDFIQSKNLEHS